MFLVSFFLIDSCWRRLYSYWWILQVDYTKWWRWSEYEWPDVDGKWAHRQFLGRLLHSNCWFNLYPCLRIRFFLLLLITLWTSYSTIFFKKLYYNRTYASGYEVAAYQVPNGRPNWGTGKPKNIWIARNGKPKYFWIAKTNSNYGTRCMHI